VVRRVWKAKMHDDDRVISTGRSYIECSDNALSTGIWDVAPGTAAPYYITSEEED
jgi:uncharacterized cupin superfamily protein